jgi:hypothetical protein
MIELALTIGGVSVILYAWYLCFYGPSHKTILDVVLQMPVEDRLKLMAAVERARKEMSKHEKHCASITKLLLSDPPQVPACDCKLSQTNPEVSVSGKDIEYMMYTEPKYSGWTCYLFGYTNYGISYQPLEGKEPNWFWRKMQYLILGHQWVKEVSDE